MRECSKAVMRRVHDSRFVSRYFRGAAIDIGGAPDPLSLYVELFPRLSSVKVWDIDDGDAQYMSGVEDGSFDLVHSSHCLEHLVDPAVAIVNWVRICRPGGYIVFTVPDEDLYEQGIFPSRKNHDHKWTFTVCKKRSWSSASVNVVDLVSRVADSAVAERIELVDATYRYSLPAFDQTKSPVAECAIEVILRRRMEAELDAGGRLPAVEQPPAELRVHFNQYLDDMITLKSANRHSPPFSNDKEL